MLSSICAHIELRVGVEDQDQSEIHCARSEGVIVN